MIHNNKIVFKIWFTMSSMVYGVMYGLRYHVWFTVSYVILNRCWIWRQLETF